MTCRETLTNIYNKLTAGINILNIVGAKINPATEDTLQDIRAKTNKLTFDDSNQLKIAGIADLSLGTVQLEDTTNIKVNPATHEDILALIAALSPLYPYYDAGEETDIDAQGVALDQLDLYVNKTMVGNVGTEAVTVQLDDGSLIPLPAGASLELEHANVDTVTFYGTGAGHVIWIVQGKTEHIRQA